MIYLHLGVHKTATTYLQDLFALNRGLIASAGRAYWPLIHLRPAIDYSIWSACAREGVLGPLRKWALRGAPFNDLRIFLEACESQVLSDENILGSAGDALQGRAYPGASGRLGRLATIFGNRQVEVWLCLRSYPQFLASLYAESLRHGSDMSDVEMVSINGSPEGEWPRLVETVHRVLPAARIVIWRYEQFAQLRQSVVERLSGVPLAQMQTLPNEQVRLSPSARAIAVHLERSSDMSKPNRILSMSMAETLFPLVERADRFDPWEPELAARMDAAYQRDMATIAALPYVEMLGT